MPTILGHPPTTHSRRGFLGLVGAAALTAGCGSASGGSAKTTTRLRYQGSAGSVTPPELAADLGYLGPVTLDWVGDTTSGPQDIQSAATGQTDFGGAFNGAVAKLHAAGAQITAVISYYGVDQYSYNGFYTLAGSPIARATDLFGKKIGMNTLGAHYEAVLDIYLGRNGVSGSAVKKVEPLVVPPITTEQSLRAHQIDVGVLGGILRDKALAAGGIKPLFTDYPLLGSFSAGTYVFRNDFLKKNQETVHALHLRSRQGHRMGPHDADRPGRRPLHADHQEAGPQRGHHGAEVLQVLRRRRDRRRGHREGVRTWIAWLEDQGRRQGQGQGGRRLHQPVQPFAAGRDGRHRRRPGEDPFDDVSKAFAARGTKSSPCTTSARRRRRRVPGHRGPQRLRQVHAAGPHRRPGRSPPGPHPAGRRR